MTIRNIAVYVRNLLSTGLFEAKYYKKFARVGAHIGTPGEEIMTIMKDGHKEVKKPEVVGVDENGNPDWVVTNPGGECYKVGHKKFLAKYELEVGEDGLHAPKGDAILALQIPETITFFVPWGENHSLIEFELKAGGYLNITDFNDIYGIQKDAFAETYAPCNENGIFEDETLRKAFGQKQDENE